MEKITNRDRNFLSVSYSIRTTCTKERYLFEKIMRRCGLMRGTKVFAGELSRTQDDILVAAIEAAIEEHGGSLTSLEVRRNGQLVLKYPDDYLSRSSETQVAA